MGISKSHPFPVQGDSDKLHGLRDQLVFWIQINPVPDRLWLLKVPSFLRCMFLSQDKFSLTFSCLLGWEK